MVNSEKLGLPELQKTGFEVDFKFLGGVVTEIEGGLVKNKEDIRNIAGKSNIDEEVQMQKLGKRLRIIPTAILYRWKAIDSAC